MMEKSETIIGLKADTSDLDDFDVSEAAIDTALAERRARIGRPAGSDKELISIRIDKETLARFRAGGPGWQTRINEVLRSVRI